MVPLLSIIVPIYNAESTLACCIDSILSQTFRSFEVILVNDGSTDNSLSLCENYACADSRVIILNKTNGGVSSARNLGIDCAKGDYIVFIDADDYLFEDSIRAVTDDLRDIDLLIASSLFSSSSIVQRLDRVGLVLKDEIGSFLEENHSHPLLSAPWAKFFKREILVRFNLRFNDSLCFGEDAVFVKEYLLHTERIFVTSVPIYYYYDIGDEIYKKYSKSFLNILRYYDCLTDVYQRLGNCYNIELPVKEVVGVVYNFVVESLIKNGLQEWSFIRTFLTTPEVRDVLQARNSLHIKNILFLSKYTNSAIFIAYFKIVEFLRNIFLSE